MKAPRFSYFARVKRALYLLAGCHGVIPTLAMRLSQPQFLIEINRIDALKGSRSTV